MLRVMAAFKHLAMNNDLRCLCFGCSTPNSCAAHAGDEYSTEVSRLRKILRLDAVTQLEGATTTCLFQGQIL